MTIYKAEAFQQGQRAFPERLGEAPEKRCWRLNQQWASLCSCLLQKGHLTRFSRTQDDLPSFCTRLHSFRSCSAPPSGRLI